RSALLAPDVINIGAHAIAIAEALARQQFIAPDNAFGAAQIDDDIAVFDALDDAVNDFADAILVFLILAFAFGIANLLDDHLFCGLRGNAAEIHRRQRFRYEIADFGRRVARFGIRQRNLARIALEFLGDFEKTAQSDFAGLAIDLGADF